MVTRQSIDEQLKKINFNTSGWGRTEIKELPNIILPDEKIFECVNGIYEGGFALLVGTNIRVVLIDKKPLNYLTVEDLRFDMINEIDYSHRLFGARISISTGSKTLRFTSLNQQRLRKLINEVQNHMADSKMEQSEHQKDQKLHLQQINQQLQSYLLAQHQQQQKLQEQLQSGASPKQALAGTEPVRPAPELSDFLFAQSLLAQHQAQQAQPGDDQQGDQDAQADASETPAAQQPPQPVATPAPAMTRPVAGPSQHLDASELYAEGVQEVFGRHEQAQLQQRAASQQPEPSGSPGPTTRQTSSAFTAPLQLTTQAIHHALEINPLRIAHAKLPMAMRNRKFGRPSFHSHSQAEEESASSRPRDVAPASY